jgi:hypothetical protein
MGFPWAYDKGQQTPGVTSPDSKKSKKQAMLSNSMCLLVSMVDTLWGESYIVFGQVLAMKTPCLEFGFEPTRATTSINILISK